MFPSDDELPTWLHTTLCFLVSTPFAAPLLYFGIEAIFTKHLEPLSGPDFGQYFFGRNPLDGSVAQIAGVSLIFDGLAFLAISLAFTRYADETPALKLPQWILLAIAIGLSVMVERTTR